MTNTLKRSGAALISLVLLFVLAVSGGAASSQNVGVKFWKEKSDKESMANTGIDSDRTATLTRQANGTYTLTLPVKEGLSVPDGTAVKVLLTNGSFSEEFEIPVKEIAQRNR